jgi:hypothetical protein
LNVHRFIQDLLDDKQHALVIEFLVGDMKKWESTCLSGQLSNCLSAWQTRTLAR